MAAGNRRNAKWQVRATEYVPFNAKTTQLHRVDVGAGENAEDKCCTGREQAIAKIGLIHQGLVLNFRSQNPATIQN